MRQLFSVFLFSFASLFFSQCEIGKISFALGDVLMFFTNGKVEEKNKNNEIQGIDEIKLEADERPENIIQMVDQMIVLRKSRQENVVQNTNELIIRKKEKPANIVESIDEIEIRTAEKPGNIIQNVYEMNVLKELRQENIPQFTNEVTILGLEKSANVVESIDEIEIEAAERPENEFQHIDEIELKAKEKERNILQKTQEISIPAKQRAENEIQQIESIELLGIERPQIKPELTDKFYLHDVKSENKIEGKDNFLIEGNNNEDVSDVNLNVNLEKLKNNDTTTPRHNRNLSNVSGSSLYSEVSTTASKNNSCINNLDSHNVDKKGVFDSDGNLSLHKTDLINSFNGAQTDEGYSCGAIEIIKKQNSLVNNIGEQPKRKCNAGYSDLIKKKIKKQEDQKRTFFLVREKKHSSIFVPIENNKISQEGGNNICKEVKNSRIGDKKDDKNVNTSGMKKYWGSNIFKLLDLTKKAKIKKDAQSDTSKLHFNILQQENIGQLGRKNQCNNAKKIRQYKQIEGGNDKYAGISSTEYDTLISEKELNVNNN